MNRLDVGSNIIIIHQQIVVTICIPTCFNIPSKVLESHESQTSYQTGFGKWT